MNASWSLIFGTSQTGNFASQKASSSLYKGSWKPCASSASLIPLIPLIPLISSMKRKGATAGTGGTAGTAFVLWQLQWLSRCKRLPKARDSCRLHWLHRLHHFQRLPRLGSVTEARTIASSPRSHTNCPYVLVLVQLALFGSLNNFALMLSPE